MSEKRGEIVESMDESDIFYFQDVLVLQRLEEGFYEKGREGIGNADEAQPAGDLQ